MIVIFFLNFQIDIASDHGSDQDLDGNVPPADKGNQDLDDNVQPADKDQDLDENVQPAD